MRYLVEKGSVAIDGISLTVFAITGPPVQRRADSAPLKLTTLGRKGPGVAVNVESDMLVKYVENLNGAEQRRHA